MRGIIPVRAYWRRNPIRGARIINPRRTLYTTFKKRTKTRTQ